MGGPLPLLLLDDTRTGGGHTDTHTLTVPLSPTQLNSTQLTHSTCPQLCTSPLSPIDWHCTFSTVCHRNPSYLLAKKLLPSHLPLFHPSRKGVGGRGGRPWVWGWWPADTRGCWWGFGCLDFLNLDGCWIWLISTLTD